MRKTFVLAVVLVLALGLIYAWGDQSKASIDKKQQNPNDVELQGVNLNTSPLQNPAVESQPQTKKQADLPLNEKLRIEAEKARALGVETAEPAAAPSQSLQELEQKEQDLQQESAAKAALEPEYDEATLKEMERQQNEELRAAEEARNHYEPPALYSTITVNILAEGFENGGAIPAGWTDSPGTSYPWLYNGGTSHGPGSPHTGSYAAYYNIYSYTYNAEDSLISPSMDLSAYSGSYQLSFWTWHSSGSDSMVVYLSEAGTLTRLFRMLNTSSWTQNIVSFASTSTDAKIYFIGYSRFGSYNIYLDDVSLDEMANDDIGAVAVTKPTGNMEAGTTYDVAGSVKNLGAQSQTFDVTMTIDDGVSLTEVYSSTVTGITLESGVQDTVDFDQFTPTTGGTFTFTLTVSNADDENTANDVATRQYTVFAHETTGGPDAGYYYWIDNYGGGAALEDPPVFNWVDASGGNLITFPSSTDSDTFTVTLPATFHYYGSDYTTLTIATDGWVSLIPQTKYNASNYGIPSLSGPAAMIAPCWDDLVTTNGNVYTLYDGTENQFIVEYDNAEFYGTAPDTMDFEIIMDFDDGSIILQYQHLDANLQTDYTVGIENEAENIGLQYFYNDDNPTMRISEGLAIKFYYNPPQDDIAAISIDKPANALFVGVANDIEGTVQNVGSLSQTFDVTMTINDGVSDVYTSTVSGITLDGGLQTAVTFDQFTPTATGDYDFTMTVSNPGDEDNSNDTITDTFSAYEHNGTGGPDGFGYNWVDNTVPLVNDLSDPPVFNWIDATGGDLISFSSTDDGYAAITLPAAFTFYGANYSTMTVSTNGWASFLSYTSGYYLNSALPAAAAPNALLAPLWDDLTISNGNAYTLYDGIENQFIIEWDNADFLGGTLTDTVDFEIVLDFDDNTIVYQYRNFDSNVQTDLTVGIENDAGDIGLEYFHDNTNPANMPYDGLAIKFYFVPPSIDAGVVSIDAPIGNFEAGLQTLTATIENAGDNTETFDVLFEVTDASATVVFTETVSTTMAPGTQQVSTTTQWDATAGAYTVSVTTQLTGDGNPFNDNLTSDHFVADTIIDFEADNAGLIGTGNWQYGTPTTGPGSAYSGSNLWATQLDGNYTTGLSVLLFGITVGSTNPEFAFEHWYDTEPRYDGGNVGISTDGGETWTLLHSAGGYDNTSATANPLYPDSLFTGHNQQQWEVEVFDLSAYAGQSILARLAFGADGSIYYPGWYVDDFMFIDASLSPIPNIEFTSIDGIKDFMLNGAAYTIQATFTNTDDAAVTLDSVVFQVFDTTPTEVFHDVITENLDIAGNSSAQFSSSTDWTASTDGIFYVYATAYLATDGLADDNGGSVFTIIRTVQDYPYVEDMEATALDLADWTIVYAGSSPGVYTTTSRYHSPTTSIYFSYSPYPRTAWLIGPPVYVDDALATNPRLRFWEDQSYWGDEPDETHAIGILVGSADLDEAVSLLSYGTEHNIAGFSGPSIQLDITSYIGQTIWPVFEFNSLTFYNSNWYLDDIGIEEQGPDPTTIYDIQYQADAVGTCYDSPFHGYPVRFSGTVTAIKQGTYPDYYLQDCTDALWNGVFVYDADETDMQIGDNVTLTGEVDEYNGLTEVINVTDFVTNSTGNEICTTTVSSDDVGLGCDDENAVGEDLEGMLVKLENVTCVVGPNGSNEAYVKTDGATDSCLVDDENYKGGSDQPAPLVEGAGYNWIIGTVHYQYGLYRVFPRFASDVAQFGAIAGVVTDASEAALQDVAVDLYSGTTLISSTTTDVDGAYEFPTVEEGIYDIMFTKTGYYDGAEFGVEVLNLETATVDITLHQPATYSGTVTDDAATALEGVHVYTEVLSVLDSKPAAPVHPFTQGVRDAGGVKADKAIKATNNGARMLSDAEYCEVYSTGDPYWSLGGWFAGEELYAVYQDPAICALSPTYPFMINQGWFSMNYSASTIVDQYLYFQMFIYDADLTDPECPAVGDLLAAGAPDSVLFPAGGAHYWIGRTLNAVVNGPYFLVVYFSQPQTDFTLITDNSSDPGPVPSCLVYNDYGSGWVDLSGPFASYGILSDLWQTVGHSTTAPALVTDTYTDENGNYELVLDPGVYNIHYELEDYDPAMAGVTLALDEVSMDNDVVLARSGYQYLPGDANMVNGQWPPQVISSDVTFLIAYFRQLQAPCLMDGFFVAGDANGDCQIISSDVTRMIAYFRQLQPLSYCVDYETLWPTPDDLPETMPEGWPPCDEIPVPAVVKTLPSQSGTK